MLFSTAAILLNQTGVFNHTLNNGDELKMEFSPIETVVIFHNSNGYNANLYTAYHHNIGFISPESGSFVHVNSNSYYLMVRSTQDSLLLHFSVLLISPNKEDKMCNRYIVKTTLEQKFLYSDLGVNSDYILDNTSHACLWWSSPAITSFTVDGVIKRNNYLFSKLEYEKDLQKEITISCTENADYIKVDCQYDNHGEIVQSDILTIWPFRHMDVIRNISKFSVVTIRCKPFTSIFFHEKQMKKEIFHANGSLIESMSSRAFDFGECSGFIVLTEIENPLLSFSALCTASFIEDNTSCHSLVLSSSAIDYIISTDDGSNLTHISNICFFYAMSNENKYDIEINTDAQIFFDIYINGNPITTPVSNNGSLFIKFMPFSIPYKYFKIKANQISAVEPFSARYFQDNPKVIAEGDNTYKGANFEINISQSYDYAIDLKQHETISIRSKYEAFIALLNPIAFEKCVKNNLEKNVTDIIKILPNETIVLYVNPGMVKIGYISTAVFNYTCESITFQSTEGSVILSDPTEGRNFDVYLKPAQKTCVWLSSPFLHNISINTEMTKNDFLYVSSPIYDKVGIHKGSGQGGFQASSGNFVLVSSKKTPSLVNLSFSLSFSSQFDNDYINSLHFKKTKFTFQPTNSWLYGSDLKYKPNIDYYITGLKYCEIPVEPHTALSIFIKATRSRTGIVIHNSRGYSATAYIKNKYYGSFGSSSNPIKDDQPKGILLENPNDYVMVIVGTAKSIRFSVAILNQTIDGCNAHSIMTSPGPAVLVGEFKGKNFTMYSSMRLCVWVASPEFRNVTVSSELLSMDSGRIYSKGDHLEKPFMFSSESVFIKDSLLVVLETSPYSRSKYFEVFINPSFKTAKYSQNSDDENDSNVAMTFYKFAPGFILNKNVDPDEFVSTGRKTYTFVIIIIVITLVALICFVICCRCCKATYDTYDDTESDNYFASNLPAADAMDLEDSIESTPSVENDVRYTSTTGNPVASPYAIENNSSNENDQLSDGNTTNPFDVT